MDDCKGFAESAQQACIEAAGVESVVGAALFALFWILMAACIITYTIRNT